MTDLDRKVFRVVNLLRDFVRVSEEDDDEATTAIYEEDGQTTVLGETVVHEEDDQIRELLDSTNGSTLKVAVMLRTSLFAFAWARRRKQAPTPIEVYQRSNTVVADHLRECPLAFPSCLACVVAFSDSSGLGSIVTETH